MDASPLNPPAPPRLPRLLPSYFVLLVTMAAATRLVLLIERYSANIFFYDQWDFLRYFFVRDPGIAELFFLQHGPHREGLGLILDKYLYPLTAWDTRVDSCVTLACLAAAALLAVLLKKRLLGRIDYWDALIPILFLTPVQYDAFVVTPNPAYSGFPILLIMLYLNALLVENVWLRYGALAGINYLLMYTGFGLFMGPLTIALFTWFCYAGARGFTSTPPAAPVAGLLAAAATFASFFYHYKFDPAVGCFVFPHHPVSDYPVFVSFLFSSALGIHGPRLFALLLGAAIFAVFLWMLAEELWRMRNGISAQAAATISILVVYTLLFAANAAVGRVCIGLPLAAQSSRYATLILPALLGGYLYLRMLSRRSIHATALTVFVLALIPGQTHLPWEVAYYADRKQAWADCYRQTENIGQCDLATNFKIYPDAARTGLQQKLDYLKDHRVSLFAP